MISWLQVVLLLLYIWGTVASAMFVYRYRGVDDSIARLLVVLAAAWGVDRFMAMFSLLSVINRSFSLSLQNVTITIGLLITNLALTAVLFWFESFRRR